MLLFFYELYLEAKNFVLKKFFFNTYFYIFFCSYVIIKEIITLQETKRAFLFDSYNFLSKLLPEETALLRLRVATQPLSFITFCKEIPSFTVDEELIEFIRIIKTENDFNEILKKDLRNPYYVKSINFLEYYIKLERSEHYLKYIGFTLQNLFLLFLLF